MQKYKDLAKELGFSWKAITGKSRKGEIVEARRIIAKAMRDDDMTYPHIGRALNRHHTTVMNLVDDEFKQARHERYLRGKK